MKSVEKLFFPAAFGFLFIIGLAFAPAVIGRGAATGSPSLGGTGSLICFPGAEELNALLPLLYYASLIVLFLMAGGSLFVVTRPGFGERGFMKTSLLVSIATVVAVGSLVVPLMPDTTPTAHAAPSDSCLLRDGSLAMTGNLNMAGFSITNTGDITFNADSTHQVGAAATRPATVYADVIDVVGTVTFDAAAVIDGPSSITISATPTDDVIIGDDSTTVRVDGGERGVWIGGTTPSTGFGWGTVIDAIARTVDGSESFYRTYIRANEAVTTTGTHSDVATLFLAEPNITVSAGSVTNASTLKIGAVPTEGDTNYALWSDVGRNRFDGAVVLNRATEPSGAGLDASTVITLIQNVSQGSNPGTTIDGQIRLWEQTASSDARIVAQINGTTYTWNNSAGLTFENRPLVTERAREYFESANEAHKADTLAEIRADYDAFFEVHPALTKPAIPEWTWTEATFAAVVDAYASAKDEGRVNGTEVTTPDVPSMHLPYPEGNYTIADEDLNETISAATGVPIREGDAVVFRVDRETLNGAEVQSIHVVPSLFVDELLAATAGVVQDRPACGEDTRGRTWTVFEQSGDLFTVCLWTGTKYQWEVR